MRTFEEWAAYYRNRSDAWLAYHAVKDLAPRDERDRSRVDALYGEISRRVDAETAAREKCVAPVWAACTGGPR